MGAKSMGHAPLKFTDSLDFPIEIASLGSTNSSIFIRLWYCRSGFWQGSNNIQFPGPPSSMFSDNGRCLIFKIRFE